MAKVICIYSDEYVSGKNKLVFKDYYDETTFCSGQRTGEIGALCGGCVGCLEQMARHNKNRIEILEESEMEAAKAPEVPAEYHKITMLETRVYRTVVIVKAPDAGNAARKALASDIYDGLGDVGQIATISHIFESYVCPVSHPRPGVYEEIKPETTAEPADLTGGKSLADGLFDGDADTYTGD